MKRLALLLAFPLVILSATSCKTTVAVKPETPVVVQPARPGPNYVWVDGDWHRSGGAYVYKQGYWVVPKQHHEWVSGHWDKRGNGWYWQKGHWR